MLNLTVGQIVDNNQPVVNYTVSMRECIEKMIHYNKGYVVILKSTIPVGILTERDILNLIGKDIDMEKSCLEYATKNIVSIPPDRNIYFAINIMLDNNIRRVVVADKSGNFIGSLTLKEILFYLEEDHFKKNIKLKDILPRRSPITIFPDTILGDVVEIMNNYNIGSLPVVDKNSYKPVGIITERDILNLALNYNPSEPVKKFMTSNLITVEDSISVYEAIKIMEENKISRLVIVKDSAIVGIINYRDIVKLLEENHKSILEKKLKHAKELLDLLPEMMIEIADDIDQQIIMWANKVAKSEFGNIVGTSIYTIVPKDYWLVIYSKLLHDKVVEKYKFENNGKTYQISATYLLLNNELGKGRIKALITNITKEEDNLKHIDKELRTYKKIINHAEDLIIIYEANTGKIKLYNDAVLKKLGYTSDEMEDMTIFDIVEEDKNVI
ncbi:MAG: CBS domain-containing protein [Hydrogenothermaceae bacterium]